MLQVAVSRVLLDWLCFTDWEFSYIQTILPLLAISTSFIILTIQIIQKATGRVSTRKTAPQVETANGNVNAQLRNHANDDGENEELEVGSLRQNGFTGTSRNNTILHKGNRKSVAIWHELQPAIVVVSLEFFAVLGELVVHLIHYFARPEIQTPWFSTVAGIILWAYLALLTSTRLKYSLQPSAATSYLWYHTSPLYGLLWAFKLIDFRSAFIHDFVPLYKLLTLIDFLLLTFLVILVLTTRPGNSTDVPASVGDMEPSAELTANLFSIATFSWVDSLLWKGYKKSLELRDIWDLIPDDKADSILSDYRQMRKNSQLAWHLLKYFKKQLILQAIWASFGGLLSFAPTLLLKAILEYIEDPTYVSRNSAWLLVALLFILGCAAALCDAFTLWLGRRTCIRLRAVMVGELYSKALKRKISATTEKSLGEDKSKNKTQEAQKGDDLSADGEADHAENITKGSVTANASEGQVTSGAIINLMAIDSFKVADITAYMHFLWATTPVQVVLSVILLYRILGYSSIAGISIMFILLPVYMVIAKLFTKTQKKILAATDKRIDTTNEVLQNIRIIKFFAWEHRFMSRVDEKRKAELHELRGRYILYACASAVWTGTPILITFFSFLVYTVIEKQDLVPSVAFSALSLFQILRAPLDQLADMIAHVQESKVSVDRIEEYLNEAETEKYDQLVHQVLPDNGEPLIGFDNANFTYGNDSPEDAEAGTAFKMMNLNLLFKVSQLNLVVGPTGSGKSSLLLALLGEMTKLDGTVYLPGNQCHGMPKPHPDTGLTENVAFCAQQAWLINDTIRENIIFASPWDLARYRNVLAACALEKDLDILDDGDRTLVGEKGVTLSGGQKQRIALARALYCKARHVLLDDVLSAVDSHTSQWIFSKALLGPLMYNRTCILVTHNVSLCLPYCQYVITLENGSIAAQGTPKDMVKSGKLGDISQSAPNSELSSAMPSRVSSQVDVADENGKVTDKDKNGGVGKTHYSEIQVSDANPNTHEEGKAEGGVKLSVILFYVRCMGPWYYWMIAISLLLLQEVLAISVNLWITKWANAYATKDVSSFDIANTSTTAEENLLQPVGANSASPIESLRVPWLLRKFHYQIISTVKQDIDVNYYLMVYAILGLSYILLTVPREGAVLGGSLNASKKIHTQLLQSVSHAKFRFFDVTPLGQLLNRFSKDLATVDEDVAAIANGLVWCVMSMISILLVISIVMPAFLIAATFITILFVGIATLYINSSRDLKRLESVQRSPLYQHFGETLLGMTTIRAYGHEQRFALENIKRINVHNRPFIYLWATNRWLALRVDVIGALVAFSAGIFILLQSDSISAGAAGLAMSYAVSFTDSLLWFIRNYASCEQAMTSVERVKEYLDVEQEAPPIIPESRSPSDWPDKGSVEFDHYSTRYRQDFDLVLKSVSFKIAPSEKVGVVGRTGAGKSSLAMALFRALEPEEGKIMIDNLDISTIGLQDLRENVVMVPQGLFLASPSCVTTILNRNRPDTFQWYNQKQSRSFWCLHR